MLTLRKLFGKDEKFYDLLEASADEVLTSTKLFLAYLQKSGTGTAAGDLDEFIQRRQKNKQITGQITEELCKTFVTPLEREDIEALSLALHRIPKTVEKLVTRLSLYPGRLPREGFIRQAELLGQAAAAVAFMVKQLRKGAKLEGVQEANERLKYAENEADKVMLGLIRELYVGPTDAKETMILQDLFEMTEKCIDRCRDAGSVVFQIVLKYS
ncbi:MAG: DUF47 family protein [Opitutaceae bacterium]|nr:DUF47 family protein [Opitutaceae bacterium]